MQCREASPEIIIHRLKEELVAGSIENIFEVGKGDTVRGNWDLNEVRRLFLVNVINYFSLFHFL